MKQIIVLTTIFLIVMFTSCDYLIHCDYIIVNETTGDIVIKTIIKPYDKGISFSDSVHVVKSGEKKIFTQGLGHNKKKYTPEDRFTPEDIIPPATKFDMYVGGIIRNELRLRKYWEYTAVTHLGTYKLRVTDSLIDKL